MNASRGLVDLLTKLDDCSREIFRASLDESQLPCLAKSYHLVEELSNWAKAIGDRPEKAALNRSISEMQFAALSLTQGHYSSAFRSLRLVLELTLQTIRLSCQTVECREWLCGQLDTSWAALMDKDSGVFSVRYARAFFEPLEVHIGAYREIAERVYRECSQIVHGNQEAHISIPQHLEFNPDVVAAWHNKVSAVAITIAFAMSLRFFCDLTSDGFRHICHDVNEQIGHIPAIRAALSEYMGS